MEQIVRLINENANFVLHGHTSPDGDAIGACYGLAFALQKLGKNVAVVLESYPQKFDIIPGREFLRPFSEFKGDTTIDVFIALDCADTMRLGSGLSLFDKAKHTVCIDHHKSNPGFAAYNHIESTTSSTCEIVYRLVEQLTTIDQNIATALYAGIVSDTGGFKYDSTTAATMDIAGHLMEIGIPFTQIYNQLMFIRSYAAVKIVGLALQNADTALKGQIIYSHITRQMFKSVKANPADLDGTVEQLLCTQGVAVAVLAYEKGEQVKISLRSHKHDVGSVAGQLGGGGHKLAAGATVTGDINSVLTKTLFLLNELLRRETP